MDSFQLIAFALGWLMMDVFTGEYVKNIVPVILIIIFFIFEIISDVRNLKEVRK